MKAVTANRLDDGAVVYLGDDDEWTIHLCVAARFDEADARDVLAAVEKRAREIASAYLIEVDETGALLGRETLRESIRFSGPTVRPDLGYQAGGR